MHGVIELQAMPKSSGVPVVPGPGPCHRENGRTTGQGDGVVRKWN